MPFHVIAKHLAACFYDLEKDDRLSTPSIASGIYTAINDAPLIHLPAELEQAFLQTKPPENVENIKLPYPSFILNLRNGIPVHNNDDVIWAIIVTDAQAAAEQMMQINWSSEDGPIELRLKFDGDIVATGLTRELKFYHVHLNLKDWFSYAREELDPRSVELRPSDEICLTSARMSRIAINSMLLLNERPELIEEESALTIKPQGRGFKRRVHPGSIRWLAKNYRRLTANDNQASRDDNGLRTTAPHWRKGHWHNVPCGKGRKERKMMWFEPVYVNGPTKARAEAA